MVFLLLHVLCVIADFASQLVHKVKRENNLAQCTELINADSTDPKQMLKLFQSSTATPKTTCEET